MQYNKRLRFLSILTAVCLCLTFFAAGAGATEKEVKNGSSAMVDTAVSQLGYYEGYSGYSKYGDYFGSPYVSWCCAFVSWCARNTGVPESVIPTNLSCTAMRSAFINKGLYRKAPYYGGNYIPKPGDLVFFSWSSNPNSLSHIGIVISANSSYAVCVEGNCPNRVRQLNRYYNSNVIGFATPAYGDVEVTPAEPVTPKETGRYTITGTMNFRSAPTTSASTVMDSYIQPGTVVDVQEIKVAENMNWGKITYNGITGWICLDYSEYIGGSGSSSSTDNSGKIKPGIYVVEEATNIRKADNADAEWIATAMPGTEITVTAVRGDWGKVIYNGVEGWMCLNWSSRTDDLTENSGILPGDVDCDGHVTSSDARVTLRASVGIEELNNEQNIAAKVENTDKITASNARTILRVSVGLQEL